MGSVGGSRCCKAGNPPGSLVNSSPRAAARWCRPWPPSRLWAGAGKIRAGDVLALTGDLGYTLQAGGQDQRERLLHLRGGGGPLPRRPRARLNSGRVRAERAEGASDHGRARLTSLATGAVVALTAALPGGRYHRCSEPWSPRTPLLRSNNPHAGVSSWRAFVLLILTVGLARFAYTPMLPIMRRRAGLTHWAAGWLATVNYRRLYGGHLAGAASINDLGAST